MASATRHPDEAQQVFTVRKEPKGRSAGKQIEGNYKPGDNVIVVDDVIMTEGSTLNAIEACGIHVLPLFTRSTLLDG